MARAEENAGNADLARVIRDGQMVEVARRGIQVTVTGTTADELFEFEPGAENNTVWVDGVDYMFAADEVSRFRLLGGGGSDHGELFDSTSDDLLEGRYNWARLSSTPTCANCSTSIQFGPRRTKAATTPSKSRGRSTTCSKPSASGQTFSDVLILELELQPEVHSLDPQVVRPEIGLWKRPADRRAVVGEVRRVDGQVDLIA